MVVAQSAGVQNRSPGLKSLLRQFHAWQMTEQHDAAAALLGVPVVPEV